MNELYERAVAHPTMHERRSKPVLNALLVNFRSRILAVVLPLA